MATRRPTDVVSKVIMDALRNTLPQMVALAG